MKSPRGPIEIDAVERDIIQNVYIRKVVRKGNRWSTRPSTRSRR